MSCSAVGTVLFPLNALEENACERCGNKIEKTCYLTVCGHVLCNRCQAGGKDCCENEGRRETGAFRVFLVGIEDMVGDGRSEERAGDYSFYKSRKIKGAPLEYTVFITAGEQVAEELLEEIKDRAIEVKTFLSVPDSPSTEEERLARRWIDESAAGLTAQCRDLNSHFNRAVNRTHSEIEQWMASHERILSNFAHTAIQDQKDPILADQAMRTLDLLFDVIGKGLDDSWSELDRMRRRFDCTYYFPPLEGREPSRDDVTKRGIRRLMGEIYMIGETGKAKRTRVG